MSEVAELVRGAYEAFSRGEFDAVVGDRILVVARVRARASGIEIDQTVYHVYTIEDGLAVRFSAHIERNDALAALHGR